MNKKKLFLIAGVFLAMASILCFCLMLPPSQSTQSGEYAPTTTQSAQTTVSSQTTQVTQTPYVSPVAFDELQQINPDIYAWITIPGTRVNYPVVQSPTDDSFYLDHDSDGNYNVNGAVFSEHLYNNTEFTDAVTVLYGHNMKSGEMFGDFQSLYWDRDFLLENDDIIIYLPDRELHFEIFAALPYSRMHLLHYYHTEKQKAFELMIDDIYSTRKLSAILLEDRRPEYGDQVLVLSTCLSGDNRYRYLVMGVCKDSN